MGLMPSLHRSSGYSWLLMPIEATRGLALDDATIERIARYEETVVQVGGYAALVLGSETYAAQPSSLPGPFGNPGTMLVLSGDDDTIELVWDAAPNEWIPIPEPLDFPSGRAVFVDPAHGPSTEPSRLLQLAVGRFTVFHHRARSASAIWLELSSAQPTEDGSM